MDLKNLNINILLQREERPMFLDFLDVENISYFGKPMIDEIVKEWKMLADYVKYIIEKENGDSSMQRTIFLNSRKKEINQKIKLLVDLKKGARNKPILPFYRNEKWFSLEDRVMCFRGEKIDCASFDCLENFIPGEIKFFYQFGEKIIVKLDRKDKNANSFFKQVNFWSPDVLCLWEYEYLCQHSKFTKNWLEWNLAITRSN